jgi:hypothetical protein
VRVVVGEEEVGGVWDRGRGGEGRGRLGGGDANVIADGYKHCCVLRVLRSEARAFLFYTTRTGSARRGDDVSLLFIIGRIMGILLI